VWRVLVWGGHPRPPVSAISRLKIYHIPGETCCCSDWTARGESWRARVPAPHDPHHLLTRQSRRFLKDLHKHFPRELSRLRVLV
jgi:hypothetical protein